MLTFGGVTERGAILNICVQVLTAGVIDAGGNLRRNELAESGLDLGANGGGGVDGSSQNGTQKRNQHPTHG